MAVLWEINEAFDAGPEGATVTNANTIFQSVGTAESGPFQDNGIFTTDSRSGFAITRPEGTSFCMLGRAVLGGVITNGTGSVSVLVPPLGGTMHATCWRKIEYGPAGGLGQHVLYTETQNVIQWTTEGDGDYSDHESCSILSAPDYSIDVPVPVGSNIWINQRINYNPADLYDDASFQASYYTVPVGVWLKFEVFYYENGSTQATVTNAADVILVDTGVVAGPGGWRAAAVWTRVRRFTHGQIANSWSFGTIDDFRLAIETEDAAAPGGWSVGGVKW